MTSDPSDLTRVLTRVVDGEPLDAATAESVFDHVMSGSASPVWIGAFLAAQQARGVGASEIAGGVRALRKAMIPVGPGGPGFVDTCGTGGGTVTTFNISTAAAIVAAAGGARIAKHGNRSFTSKSGSADVLEALGVKIDLTPERMGEILDEIGIVFMFAPLLHPAMRHVGPVRRELGIRTIMNLLGPLTNPAGADRQVVGVADPDLVPPIVEALRDLGHARALVVHGEPGMDELSPLGVTRIAELKDGEIREYHVTPESAGVKVHPVEGLSGGEPDENAARILDVLRGDDRAAARAAVVLNAGAALYVADGADTLVAGVEKAGALIDSGAALEKLERLREASNA